MQCTYLDRARSSDTKLKVSPCGYLLNICCLLLLATANAQIALLPAGIHDH